jgi:hypothetical protein
MSDVPKMSTLSAERVVVGLPLPSICIVPTQLDLKSEHHFAAL